MSEMERLLDRLFPEDGPHIKNIHIEWGPEAHRLTPEERARVINKVLDEVRPGASHDRRTEGARGCGNRRDAQGYVQKG